MPIELMVPNYNYKHKKQKDLVDFRDGSGKIVNIEIYINSMITETTRPTTRPGSRTLRLY